MTRALFTACGLLVLAAHVHAQASSIQLGATAGAAISTLVGDDAEGGDSRTAPHFGISFVWQGPGVVGFESGALFVPKGSSYYKINYIEVPLLFRFGLNLQGSSIRPTVAVGGSMAIKTGCKLEFEDGITSEEIDCDDSTFAGELDTKGLDFGISAGVGVDIPAGNRAVIAPALRYVRAIADVGDTSNDLALRNSSVQISVSLRFRM